MNDTLSVAGHVAAAAESVRQANHTALSGSLSATDAYDVVGGLVDVVGRLLPLLERLGRALCRADSSDYFDDRGAAPGITLLGAQAGLVDAADVLDRVTGHLTHAHNQLGHLGRHIPED